MQLLQTVLKKVNSSRVDWVGLRHVREATTERMARDGRPELNQTNVTEGVMVEVLVDGQFGYAATPRMDEESLLEACRKAERLAADAAKYKVFAFTEAQRPKIVKNYASPFQKPFSGMSPKDINDLLIQICGKLKSAPEIVRTEAFARTVEMETWFVSSNGSDAHQKFGLITTDFQATAEKNGVVQRRTDGGLRGRSFQGGWEYFVTDDLWQRVARVGEQVMELVHAEPCPTEAMDLVLKPDQMMLQIHESIGHPLEVDRILGDERNYAGWSFVKPEDFGTLQYGSKLMNVTFDPTVANEYASYAFDDTGTEAKREFLIQDGLLVRGLGGGESQIRSGLPGVANQRASSWNRAPIDRMANLNLEVGTSSMDEIIGSIRRGVIMESNRSWSIDDFRNKFQFGCEYARLIENGKVTKVLRDPNYRGITVPFWRALKKVGDASTRGLYGTPYCGKGEPNQIIRVGHASPVCLFEGIEVFGGGK